MHLPVAEASLEPIPIMCGSNQPCIACENRRGKNQIVKNGKSELDLMGIKKFGGLNKPYKTVAL